MKFVAAWVTFGKQPEVDWRELNGKIWLKQILKNVLQNVKKTSNTAKKFSENKQLQHITL